MEERTTTEERVLEQLLGHWEWTADNTTTYTFDRLLFFVAESGIIVKRFRNGQALRQELHPLKGARMERDVFIIPSSLYFATEISDSSLVLGKNLDEYNPNTEFLIPMRRISSPDG